MKEEDEGRAREGTWEERKEVTEMAGEFRCPALAYVAFTAILASQNTRLETMTWPGRNGRIDIRCR
jgi:hypothetical protein